MQHLHTDYERELVPLFVKVLGEYASGSKLEDDAADCSQIIAVKLGAQPNEQPYLLGVEGLAVGQIIGLNSDTSTIPATDSLNRVRTSERRNVPPDCHLGNIELMRQIVVCIMPSET